MRRTFLFGGGDQQVGGIQAGGGGIAHSHAQAGNAQHFHIVVVIPEGDHLLQADAQRFGQLRQAPGFGHVFGLHFQQDRAGTQGDGAAVQGLGQQRFSVEQVLLVEGVGDDALGGVG